MYLFAQTLVVFLQEWPDIGTKLICYNAQHTFPLDTGLQAHDKVSSCGWLLMLWRQQFFFSEICVTTYHTTRRHYPKDKIWNPHRCKNLECHTVLNAIVLTLFGRRVQNSSASSHFSTEGRKYCVFYCFHKMKPGNYALSQFSSRLQKPSKTTYPNP
jgi:hypothetical protein